MFIENYNFSNHHHPFSVSRKVSTLSTFTKDTRDRVLSSLFSPIIALNRGRKQTKAEKRAHKAFRTITFIVGFFAILWSPYYVVVSHPFNQGLDITHPMDKLYSDII